MVDTTHPNPSVTYSAATEKNMIDPPRRIEWKNILIYLFLIFGTIIAVLPFFWMVGWSLMTNVQVISGRMIPNSIHLSNYSDAWEKAHLGRYMWNSVRITTISVLGTLAICIPAAYAFARMRFFGRNIIFGVLLSTLMIPDIVTLIPNFLMVSWLSRFSESIFGEAGAWMNNWPALTVPFWASAFTIFLLRQFFAQIPDELWDAARIDGASHFTFLLRVVIPLSKAPIMTVLTFTFIGSWNALLWPLLVVNTDDWRPIAFGLQRFVAIEGGTLLNLQMAASVVMILPIVILYFFTQKQFTKGLYSGSFKG